LEHVKRIEASTSVPEIRIRVCNSAPVRPDGAYVLYWMIAARRTGWNFALDRAIEWALRLSKPLVVLESLRADFPWASERIRRFVLAGMRDNAADLKMKPVFYFPYLEAAPGEGRGLLEAFSARAAVIVTDEFPCFFLPRMVASAARRVSVLLEQVDSNGILPMRAAPQAFPTAYAFRRFLHKNLPEHLRAVPQRNPFKNVSLARIKALPREITSRWPMLRSQKLSALLSEKPIGATPANPQGGALAAQDKLRLFVHSRLAGYEEDRNLPELDASSGLSPYLHFGHISAHQIFAQVASDQDWGPNHLALRSTGSRVGWWGMSAPAEAFLDQVVTWRELGFNMCHHRADYDQYESLPEWARMTLAVHESDRRTQQYTLEEFENAATHDPLWNAAQTQLVREGRIHNYLRMLWGKKILEWTPSPRKALAIMIELNNKYALDGRDPNSYSGILWCLGRYDRPWGPERPVFGKVRYMSSENTARKMRVAGYIRKYQGAGEDGTKAGRPMKNRKARA
jgi:deoxyribodipyrimidine photo-lyase